MRPLSNRLVEVFKYVRPGTPSAWVVCQMTPDGRSPEKLTSTMLVGKRRIPVARLRYDANGGYAAVHVIPSGQPEEPVRVDDRDWHIFNMDLADVMLSLRSGPETWADFRFIEPNPQGMPAMIDTGVHELELVAITKRGEQWRLSKDGVGGDVIFDRSRGCLVEARLPWPNHDGYHDFKLSLKRAVKQSDVAWRRWVAATVNGA